MVTQKVKPAGKRPRLRSALDEVRKDIAAIPESELLVINLEPLAIVAITRGALPELMKIRGEIGAALPGFDLGLLDRLETYALALMQANSAFLAAKEPQKDRARLAAESYRMRAQLLQDIVTLKSRGYLESANLSDLRGANGHLNIACDLMTLANLLRDNWAKVSPVCGVTLEELDQAEVICDDFTRVLGQRGQPMESVLVAASQRRRAFTLLVRAYSEARHAVAYVRRRPGEVDRIAPSFFKKKRGRKNPETIATGNSQTNEAFVIESTATPPPDPSRLTDADPFLH